MNAALVIVLVVVALIVIVVGVFIAMYNKFARQRNTIEESWRQIDVELQRRHDLIGNLVEVVTASARFEQRTLTGVIEARTQAVAARGAGPARQGQAEQQLNGALSNFFAVAEQYPDLKASRDFHHLQEQMVETEDRVAAGRRFYNGNVRAFNTRFDTFPSSVVANMGNFQKKEYYEVDDPGVRAAPSLRGAFEGLNEPVTPTPPMGQQAIQQAPPTQPIRAQPSGGTMPADDSRSMPEQPPQTPPAPPIPPSDPPGSAMPEQPPQAPPAPPVRDPEDEPGGGAMPEQPPQAPPAPPVRDPEDEPGGGAMPDDPPQTPPAPLVQPPDK
ncbi:MAG TPA: LemA family protein [Actinophytocola sp.]|nr:LemA family protein [Actinophytocola sp.]